MEKVKIGNATLYCGDCLEIITTLYGEKISAILTDPPYGIDYYSNQIMEKLWADGDRIIGDKDTTVRDSSIDLSLQFSCPMLFFGTWKVQRPKNTKGILIWDQGSALGMGDLSIPWKLNHQEIYILGSGFVGKRDSGSVIYSPPCQSMAKNGRKHPNEKPVALLETLLHKMPSGLVADWFMGSGSTGVACIRSGRSFIGIEKSRKYFDIACRRIEQAVYDSSFFLKGVIKKSSQEQGSLMR